MSAKKKVVVKGRKVAGAKTAPGTNRAKFRPGERSTVRGEREITNSTRTSNESGERSTARLKGRKITNSTRTSNESYGLTTNDLLRLWGTGGDETVTGMRVNEDTALNFSAVYSAISLLTGALACMPLKMYRRRDDGRGRDIVTDGHPSTRVIQFSPDGETPAYLWREAAQGWALRWGYTDSEIVRNGRGQCTALHLLDPRKVTLDRAKDGSRLFLVKEASGVKKLDNSQVLHIPCYSDDGYIGKSPIRLARESIGLGLAAEYYGSTYFGKGGQPLGFLTFPGMLRKIGRDIIKDEWDEWHGSMDKAFSVGLLSGGLEWKDIGFNHKDAEFLALRHFQVEEVARWFRVPPHMLAKMDKATYNNIEHMLIEFLIFSLLPWVKRWEGELNMKLFTYNESFKYYVEFTFDALLRPDSETRHRVYETEIKNGYRTIEEVREMENLNPYEDGLGSKPLIMANNLATLADVESGKTLKQQGEGGKEGGAKEGGGKKANGSLNGVADLLFKSFDNLPPENREEVLAVLNRRNGPNGMGA